MPTRRPRSEKEKARSRERAKKHYERKKQDPEAYEKLLAYNRQWAANNPEKMAEYSANWRAKQTPERRRAIWLKSKYKLTEEQYQEILAHDGTCDSCGETPEKPHVDHCHATGRFRGILCPGCNQAAGLLRDSPEKALALSQYLERVISLT